MIIKKECQTNFYILIMNQTGIFALNRCLQRVIAKDQARIKIAIL